MKVWFGEIPFDCEAIGFDKDGTLVDRAALWQGLYDVRLPILRDQLEENVFAFWHSICGVDPASGEIDPHGPLALGSRAEEVHVLATAIYQGGEAPWDQAVSRARGLLTAADEQLPERAFATPLEGVPRVLLDLSRSGLPMAIITSDHEDRTRRSLQILGLDDVVSQIVTPEHVPHGKPAPDMVQHAAKKLNVEATRMAVVGDTRVDMQMAQAAGAFPVAVLYPDSDAGMTSLARASIHSISDIRLGGA